jgi:hypothetical protein
MRQNHTITGEDQKVEYKNLSNLTAKFHEGVHESWHIFCPFCMDESEQNEAKG